MLASLAAGGAMAAIGADVAGERPAIVTIGPGGHLRIEGSRADWIFGVGPEKIGDKAFDPSGRRASDGIPDIELTLA